MKRQRGEKAKSLAFALALLFAFVSFAPQAKAGSLTQKFSKDLDFSVWNKNKTELVGSDGGVKLSTNPSTGGYYTSGTLTYKFTPGGTNRWTNATIDISSEDTANAWYAWGSDHKTNSVKQMDPETGSIIKSWTTNTSALAGVAGINADYWVSNLSPYDNASQTYSCSTANMNDNLCYSISHILPSQNKIVTRKIPSATNRNLSTVSFDTANHNLWVGDSINDEVIILNTDSFDNTAIALNYEVISTTYSPYRSAFSASSNAFCFSAYQVGLECISAESNHTTLTISEDRANEIYVDANGDFWYSGNTIHKMRPVFTGEIYNILDQTFADPLSSLSDWDYQNSEYIGVNQIAIIPSGIAGANYEPKLVLSTLKSSEVDYYPVTNNALPSLTTIGTKTTMFAGNASNLAKNYRASVNISPDGAAIYSGIGQCGSNNPCGRFFDVLSRLDDTPRLNSSTLYNVGEYSISDERNLSRFYIFENFIASSYGTKDTGALLSFSIDNKSWVNPAVNGDISLANSNDLYIKVALTGTPSSSPIFKSLSIQYESSLSDNSKTVIERSTFASANDREKGTPAVSTFETGQKVYARTKIYEPNSRSSSVTLEETVTNVKDFSLVKFAFKSGSANTCQTPIDASTVAVTSHDPTYKFIFPSISSALTCIDYEYTSL